jgi:NAD-dependent dihydropyrimidine dehydrogenase PreA subunit
MLKFILRFPRGKARVILINNRAGMKMGKLFTPGISGIAVLLPMIILLIKGYRIHGVLPLDTPSNWISIHPGIRKKVLDSIFKHRDNELTRLWNRLRNNKLYYPLKFFLLLPVDIFVTPISFGYLFFGRFLLARTYLADLSCNGCGLCAEKCPVRAIRMVNNRPWWTYRCESCMRCSNICPNKAVNSSVPLMVIYTILILRFGQGGCFTNIISSLAAQLSFIPREVVYYVLLWIVTIFASWLFYVLIFWLNRLKLFNMLFAFSTPMKYWRRYIAPGFRERVKKGF